MRAVILATTEADAGSGRTELAALRPVLDRPILQHLVERLVDQGVRELEVVVSDHPEAVRALLGDGRRWGVSVRYQLARDGARPAAALKRAARGGLDPVAIALGDTLVPAALPIGSPHATVFCTPGPADDGTDAAGGPQWSGLAWAPPRLLEELPDATRVSELGPWLIDRAHACGAIRAVPGRLSTRTPREWIAAQSAALAREVSGLLFDGRESEPGVWLGRNVRVEPGVRFVAPVWVGENTRVEGFATLGPGAAVGAGSIVGPTARVESAVVLPGTYVGEGLELRDAIANHGTLTHARIGASVDVADAFLLSAVEGRRRPRGAGSPLSRALGALLLALLSPALAVARLRLALRRERPVARDVVRQPVVRPGTPATFRLTAFRSSAAEGPSLADLFGRVVPGLVAVAAGRLRLVGVTPRSPAELADLPADWREVCARTPAGLITEPAVQLDPGASAEEVAAADAVYAVSRSLRHDARLALRYAAAVFTSQWRPELERQAAR